MDKCFRSRMTADRMQAFCLCNFQYVFNHAEHQIRICQAVSTAAMIIVPYIALITASILIPQSLASNLDISCHEANITCYLKEECRVRMEFLHATCGPYGQYCSLPQSSKEDLPGQSYVDYCRSAMQSIKNFEPNLHCYCTLALNSFDYSNCIAVWRFLEHHPCVDNVRWLPTKSSHDNVVSHLEATSQQFNLNSSTKVGIALHPLPEQKRVFAQYHSQGRSLSKEINKPFNVDCVLVDQRCENKTSCRWARHHFQQMCVADNHLECTSQKTSCMSAYADIRRFGFLNCTCLAELPHNSLQRCAELQQMYQNNSCLDYYEQKTLGISHVSKTPTAVLNDAPNCVNVFHQCVLSSSTKCLERMVSLAEDCMWNQASDQCHSYSKCLQALSIFYSSPMNGLRSAALDCQCLPDDLSCHRQLEVFRPRCAYKHGKMPSCLQLYSKCETDHKQCFAKLTVYSRACDSDIVANSHRSCQHSASLSHQCRDQRHVIWGSILTLHCSCNPLQSDDRQLVKQGVRNTCRKIKKLLTNPFCLVHQNDINVKMGDTAASAVDVIEKIGQQACRIIHTNYNRNDVILYHNDSCSQICTCSIGGDSIITQSCTHVNCKKNSYSACEKAAIDYQQCQCVDEVVVCAKNSIKRALDSGLYFNVAYSLAESHKVNKHVKVPIDIDGFGNLLNQLLSQTIGHNRCHFDLIWRNASRGKALFQVTLLHARRKSASMSSMQLLHSSFKRLLTVCQFPLRLLRLFIIQGYPEIMFQPQLSTIKSAQVTVKRPSSRKQMTSNTIVQPKEFVVTSGRKLKNRFEQKRSNCGVVLNFQYWNYFWKMCVPLLLLLFISSICI